MDTTPKPDKPLSPKQRRFVEEYLVDLNATQAAIRAGYSPRTANEQASRLLTNVSVQKYIQAAMRDRSARVEITQDYVLNNLKEIVERSMQRAPVCDMRGNQITEEGKHVWSFNGKVAVSALNLLGKHLGMFPEKRELSGPNGEPIPVASVREVIIEVPTHEPLDAARNDVPDAIPSRPGAGVE